MKLLERIKAYLAKNPKGARASASLVGPMNKSPDERLGDFMEMLAITEDEEISCDDVHHLMAQYAELLEQGGHPEELMPLVRQHLEMCHECEEELEMLLEILQSSS